MTPEKSRRVATAVDFLSGVLAIMDAMRDSRILWPPGAVWETLRSAQRLEVGGGLALIVVTLVISAVRRQN
jgi:hypothetical protein